VERARVWRASNARTLDAIGGLLLTVFLFGLFSLAVVGSRPIDGSYVIRSFWILLPFLGVSILATVASFAMGFPIGFLTGWARTLRGEPFAKLRARARLPTEPLSPSQRRRLLVRALGILALAGVRRVLRRIADGYVEIMRGTPLFVQILFSWSFFLIKFPGLDNQAIIAGIVAMTANTGGYQGEIFRAGLQSVLPGQVEAARAIGLTRLGTMRSVVLPQALRLVIPPLLNEFIGLFKASALLYFIGVQELTYKYKELGTFETRIFELFAVVTFLYLMFTIPLARLVGFIERRYRIPGLGAGPPPVTPRRGVRSPAS